MSKLNDTLSQTWFTIQTSLFPWLSEELGELTEKQQEIAHVESANFPVAYCGLKIITSLSLRFPDFQRS